MENTKLNIRGFGFADESPPEPITKFFTDLFKVGEVFAESDFVSLDNSYEYCEEAYKVSKDEEWFKKKTGKDIKKDCARKYSLSVGTGVPVISLQLLGKGGRNFMVTSWPSFLSRYFRKKLDARSYYENIYRTDPCRIYVDIETAKGSEGNMLDDKGLPTENYQRREKMVLRFARALSLAIDYFYSKDGLYASKFFVVDSSSKDRFSQHLIFHLNEDAVRFRSSVDLQAFFEFIRRCCTFDMQNTTTILDGEGNPFFWPERLPPVNKVDNVDNVETDANKKYVYMVDMTVYGNKSREFRIAGSTKRGQARYMTPRYMYKRNMYRFELGEFTEQGLGHLEYRLETKGVSPIYDPSLDDNAIKEYFYDMLVCFIPQGRIIEMAMTFSLKKKEFMKVEAKLEKGEDHKKKGASSNAREKVSKDELEVTELSLLSDMTAAYQNLPESLKLRFKEYEQSIEVKRDNLFELVANDIIQQNPIGLEDESLDAVGYLNKNWFYHVSFRTPSKYCSIKGDEHSSNHVYYVAELQSKRFYQRCWNKECCAKREALWASKQKTNEVNDDDDTSKEKSSKRNEIKSDEEDDDDDDEKDVDSQEEKLQKHFGSDTKSKNYSCRSDFQLINMSLWREINDFLKYESDFKRDCRAFLNGTYEEPEKRIIMDVEDGDVVGGKRKRSESDEKKDEGKENETKKYKIQEKKEKKEKEEDSDEELLKFLF